MIRGRFRFMTKRTDPPDLTAASAPAKPAPLYDAETDLPRTEDGVPHLQFEQIRRVGLADLTAVAEYHVEPCVGAVSHHIRLVNGGVIRFAYSLAGDLLELSAEKVLVAWDGDGVVLFDALPPEPATRSHRRDE